MMDISDERKVNNLPAGRVDRASCLPLRGTSPQSSSKARCMQNQTTGKSNRKLKHNKTPDFYFVKVADYTTDTSQIEIHTRLQIFRNFVLTYIFYFVKLSA
jgi:hypothetical protein